VPETTPGPIPLRRLACSNRLHGRTRSRWIARGLERAIQRAAPLVRARLAALGDVPLGARPTRPAQAAGSPWVLDAARRRRAGERAELARLDALVSRLALGMTAGEELSLEQILARRSLSRSGPFCPAREAAPTHTTRPPGRGARAGCVEPG